MSSYTPLSDRCNSIPSSRSVIHSEPLLNVNVYRKFHIQLDTKQLTHTVHIVFIYFTLLKVMNVHVQYHVSMRATDSQSNEDTQVLQRDHRLPLPSRLSVARFN